ncbi:proteoglycan 4 [Pelobates cultripes]|uniref:Proteoglycan 4 n=1 Tax=Pelobates cultripes TaxID=61616 RepID=A0AAD1SVD2_PELCU|nr:proteoglycan 4 [Pelobates cultripes]
MDSKTLYTQLAICILVYISTASSQSDTSCVGRCGEGYFRGHACHCDYTCMSFMECCQDFKTVCTTEASCKGRCHEGFIRGQTCDCDPGCESYGRCCSDYKESCAKPTERHSPPPRRESSPAVDERDRTPEPTRKPNGERERDDYPADPDQDPETSKPRSPPKNKKKPAKKPKKNPKKKKVLAESEEKIEESEENVSSSSFSSSSSSSSVKGSKTTKKLSRKNLKKNKPGDEDNPDDEPKKKRPTPVDDEGKPKKPRRPKMKEEEDDPENPETPPEDPNHKDGKPKNPKDKDRDEPEDPDRLPKEPNQPDGKEDKPKKPNEDDDPDRNPKEPNQPDGKEDKPKKPKTPKDGDEDDDPDRNPKEPNQPDGKEDKPKKPKTPKDGDEDDDPDRNPKEPNQPDGKEDKPKKPKTPKDGDEDDDPDRNPKVATTSLPHSSVVRATRYQRDLHINEPKQGLPDDKDDKPKTPDSKDGEDTDGTPKGPNPRGSDDEENPNGTPKDPNPINPGDKAGNPKKPKTPKEKGEDEPEGPDGIPKEPNQKGTPDSEDGKPKNPKEKEPGDNTDPDGKPKEPTKGKSPSSATPSPDEDNRLRKLKLEEEEEVTTQDDSLDNISSSSTKNTKKRSPGNGNKKPNKPIDPDDPSRDPKFHNEDTEDLVNPGKDKNPKNKSSPKDVIKKKKKTDSEEERQETVESEFSSSSQSSSSHRRSKSSSRRLSGKKQKNIEEKNKKKIPDEKPLVPPKRRKEKEFPPTPEPTFKDDGSGDDGSGMDFFQTSPSTTTEVTTKLTTKDFQSTAKPEDAVETSPKASTGKDVASNKTTATSTSTSILPSEEHTLRNPTMSTLIQHSTSPEDKTKQPSLGTDKPYQLTSTLAPVQEQSTKDLKSYGNSQTTNSQGLQETTNTRLSDIISTGPTKDPTSSFNKSTSPSPTNVGPTTVKAVEHKHNLSGESTTTISVGTETKMPDISSTPVESIEIRLSTQMTNENTSPTAGTKIDTTTKSAGDTPSSASVQTKETVTLMDGDMGKTSTVINFDESQKSTIKPSVSHQERTTSTDESLKYTTRQPEKDLNLLPKTTIKPKIDMEQRITTTQKPEGATTKDIFNFTPKDNMFTKSSSTNMPQYGQTHMTTKSPILSQSTNPPGKEDSITQKPRSYITARPIGIEEIENKNETNYPLPIDPFHICDLLKDPENKIKISEIDLQRLTQVCIEMRRPVSTPSSETRQPGSDQIKVPSHHTITTILQPKWNQPPGSRFIQLIEEIKRRANIPQTPNLIGVPGLYTNKSTAWLLLLNKFRSPNDPQMNLCIGPPADGMTTLQNGSMVVFRGHYFWMLNQGGVTEKPRKISEVWGIPSPIDTVFTRCNCGGKTFFFKGPNYWRFTNDAMDPGYPKQIIKGFGGLKGKITAVLSVAGVKTRPESVYFFKNGGNVQKYTYRQEQTKKCSKRNRPAVQYPINAQNIQTVKYRFPRQIIRQRIQIHRTLTNVKQAPLGVLHEEVSVRSTWRGIPNNIVSAVSLPNPQKQDGFDYYVFSKEKYYNINMSSKVAVKMPAQSEQKTTKDWYKCKE